MVTTTGRGGRKRGSAATLLVEEYSDKTSGEEEGKMEVCFLKIDLYEKMNDETL